MSTKKEAEARPMAHASAELVKESALPAAKQFGKAAKPAGQIAGDVVVLGARSVRALLAPVRFAVWGVERIEDWLSQEVEERLANVPDAKKQSPDPQIAVPAVHALTYAGGKPELRSMFTNLIASAINVDTASKVHPSFVEFIKQLSCDEAKILQYFATQPRTPFVEVRIGGLKGQPQGSFQLVKRRYRALHTLGLAVPEIVDAYVDNLARLGLCEILSDQVLADDGAYEELELEPNPLGDIATKNPGALVFFERRLLILTALGLLFVEACILDQ